MIINFSFENFGSLKDRQTLSFEADNSTELEDHYVIPTVNGLRLLKLGLIYGANASGKTTILKALDFLRTIVLQPADRKTISFDFNPFLFDPQTSIQNTVLSIDFVQRDVRYYYEVELNQKAIVREELNFYKPNKASVFRRVTDLEKQFTEITFGSKIKKDKKVERNLERNTLWNNTVLGGFLKTNIEQYELKEVTDWFAEYLSPLIYTGSKLDTYISSRLNKADIKKENVISILKKADFNISDIFIREEERYYPEELLVMMESQAQYETARDKFIGLKNEGKFTAMNVSFEHTVNNRKYRIPFELESNGTQRYYGFAGLLSMLIEKSEMLPIDELDASLHPDLFVHFILTFLMNAKKSQILATTHNREILSNKDIFRNDVIWFTDKNEHDATVLYSLADFDSKVIRDTSNVYNAYKAGKLGGVPNLGDYFLNITDAK